MEQHHVGTTESIIMIVLIGFIAVAYYQGEKIGYKLGFSQGKLDVCDVTVVDKFNNKTWCVVEE